ncbi:SDR family oxidoreductase [Kitasatospora aureofaciens]|uniref:SDR family oxidoreductase n=1 Tax=Kitasatospora aureofaciens TaxID=1894 RepID=UPI001C446458|nr:NAD(P)H-binding protein [Kitasatospora aureofaciens]MBV6702741.1 NAD(P)H-binding protein [Kitasatospora aureofaciens]
MTILITGARGKVGQAVLDRLHAAGLPVRAASAKPAELTVPAGIEAVELVLDRPGTFAAALDGVRKVFLYPEPAGIAAFVEAARAAGVEHVVLLSSASVLAPDAATDPLASHSLRVEQALTASGLSCTFLRPDAFASNAFAWAHPIAHGLPVQLAYPAAHIAPIHPEDIADVAVEALTGTSLAGRAVTLTGARSMTFREQLATLADVLGHDVTVETITPAEAEQQMSRFMPAPMVGSLLALWAAACAGPAVIGDTTETLLGTPARSFRQWAVENSAAFTLPKE